MTFRSLARPLAALLLLASIPSARADEYTDKANALYRTISQDKRSDLVILPLVAKMDAPPASASTLERAMLLPAKSAGWSAAEQWANAAPQRAALAALEQITKEERSDESAAFGLPYGADALGGVSGGPELIATGLYVDLGDPPMLAGAKFQYLAGLEKLACLSNVEATRLAASGDPSQAIHTMVNWLFFCRQMADRQMYVESRWGIVGMVSALERMRDIAYVDSRSPKPVLTAEQILSKIDRVRDVSGFLRLDRLRFPEANRIAAQQTIAMVFDPGTGKPNAAFGQNMARLASSQRPLRLFAEAARWGQIAANHAPASDTSAQLAKVYDDIAGRWPLSPFNVRNESLTDYEKMDKDQFAVLAAVVPDMTPLFNARQVMLAHAVGTRESLGILAFFDTAKNFPPIIESIRPRFVKEIEADPFNSDRARGKQPPLQYYVPIRDEVFPAGTEKHPHEINLTAGDEAFQVKVGDDQFVLYSVGPNDEKEWANNVSAFPAKGAGGDLLLWPPATSLLRQRLIESNRLN